MERILFKEEQRFTQWWLWLIVTASFAVPLLFIVREIAVLERDSEEYKSLLTSIYFLLGMGSLMVGLFVKMKLVTEITSTGIRVKFPPVKMRWKSITKDEIAGFEVKEYRPIKDFGGWGYRKNLLRKKDAYNVKGNIGLQLFLKNGKTLLIGTQRKQAIKFAMDKLFADEDLEVKKGTAAEQTTKGSWFIRKGKKLLIIFALEAALIIVIFSVMQLFNLF